MSGLSELVEQALNAGGGWVSDYFFMLVMGARELLTCLLKPYDYAEVWPHLIKWQDLFIWGVLVLASSVLVFLKTRLGAV